MPVPAGVPVFAVDAVPPPGTFVLSGAEGRHAATVRRLRSGERLALTDGQGAWTLGAVIGVGRDELTLAVEEPSAEPAPRPAVTVVQALPKGDRSELAVELATEAGADRIVPWSAARCVARWDGGKTQRGQQRWQHVAREAAKQSRRVRFPVVEPLLGTGALGDRIRHDISAGAAALVLHESADTPLAAGLLDAPRILLVIGPEGGIDPGELIELAAAGANVVRLGPEVLRTSTAAAVALGAIGALTPRWTWRLAPELPDWPRSST